MKQMSRTLRQRLDIVWAKGAAIGVTSPDRYVPKAIGMGPGWGVWDRKRDRHLSNIEVVRIPASKLRDEKWTQ